MQQLRGTLHISAATHHADVNLRLWRITALGSVSNVTPVGFTLTQKFYSYISGVVQHLATSKFHPELYGYLRGPWPPNKTVGCKWIIASFRHEVFV